MTPTPMRSPALAGSARRTATILAILLVIGLTGGTAVLAAQAKPGAPAPNTPPPKPAITAGPADPTNQQSATFSFSDARSGVSFLCQRDGSAFAACTSPKKYAGPVGAGSHTFAVKAVDAGGQSAPATFTWFVDRTKPLAPTLTSTPARPTTETKATFGFSAAETGLAFRCQLDKTAVAPCTSGVTYTGLAAGSHTFVVRAVDLAGNSSGSTRFSWTVLAPVHHFSIAGSLADALYPGAVAGLDVAISNPYNFAIYVSDLAVQPNAATTRDGQPNPACDGTVNLVTHRQYSGPVLVIPKRSTKSLSDLAIPQSQWPELQMPNLSTNQDACKGTTFTFAYSAFGTREAR